MISARGIASEKVATYLPRRTHPGTRVAYGEGDGHVMDVMFLVVDCQWGEGLPPASPYGGVLWECYDVCHLFGWWGLGMIGAGLMD